MASYFLEFRFAASVWEFVFNAFLAAMGRAMDVGSTYYVTRQMKLETNRRLQKVGWKGTIYLQIPAIFISSFNTYIAFFVFLWSLFIATSNLEGSYYIREKGEDAYRRELIETVQKVTWRKLVIGEAALLGTMVVSGALIAIFLFLGDYMGIFFVALALISHGLLKTTRSLQYLKRLRALPLAEGGAKRFIPQSDGDVENE